MAVISIKGKQYLVKEGEQITVPNLGLPAGEKVSVEDMISKEKLVLTVEGEKRGKKIRVEKFRNKTRYHKVIGYKDKLTLVKVGKEEQVKPKTEKKPAAKKTSKPAASTKK